jgi:hypothetical protein
LYRVPTIMLQYLYSMIAVSLRVEAETQRGLLWNWREEVNAKRTRSRKQKGVQGAR